MDIKVNLILSESQKNYNEKRYQELISHPFVNRFLKENQLTTEDLKKNISKFDRFIRYQEHDPNTQDLVVDGYDLELVYDHGIIDFQYVISEKSLRDRQLNSHLEYYLLNHLPVGYSKLSFEQLDLANESANFIMIVSKLIDLSFFNKHRGLFLYGDVGCGKTYLMACLANKVAKDKHNVCFVKVNRLMNDLKASFNLKEKESTDRLLNKMMACDLLVLDDIGAENVTSWSRDDILFTILDYRMENQKLTCFTSNLDQAALKQHYLSAASMTDPNKVDRLMERILVLSEFVQLHSTAVSRRLANL